MVIVMKNILNYYYHIIVDDNKKDNDIFSYNNHFFCLYQYKRNIKEIDSLVFLNKIMLSNGISINKIVNNIFNQAIIF